ncbi:MAG: hypothetical protein A3B81_01325 [Candidatus Muproteobacteria bacterium RIFCSPHIGHO2_02_FULL_65_16]|uniref:Uncharacterized protein n=1 Tax=Candidatus Muproteobacteria bacterium RIFCSPHIGHO2_02_FULL_65_16 TaxID=1817766 RepID=A0A1F6U1G4_9PROT|nr:MAG: hypothetical protein A3B81_01325 [Candidatus Muproteobacteria bacterium RIFCSPHIGHO2_02_FULL_65_16]
MTFRLLRRLKGFDPGPSEQQPIGMFKWIHAAAIINRRILAFFVLYGTAVQNNLSTASHAP